MEDLRLANWHELKGLANFNIYLRLKIRGKIII